MSAISNYQYHSNIHKTPSFGSIRLFKTTLRKVLPTGEVENIPAYFSKLTQKDTKMMESINGIWKNLRYGDIIMSDFMGYTAKGYRKYDQAIEPGIHKNFFVIERANEKNPIKRIASILETNVHDNYIYLECLQSASKLNSDGIIKGAGERMLENIVKYAQKVKRNNIELVTHIGSWYRKLGFYAPKDIGACYLEKKDFNKLIKKISDKYDCK